MSTTTANLGLFKYDTTTDGNLAFNITTALNNNWDKIDAAVTGGSSRNIGEIVASTIPLVDAGLHLLDGALIQGSGSYGAFVSYIAGLYTADSTANYFTTEADWQTTVSTYGVCGKFVYDSVNNTVRLPKYNSKIYTGGGTAPVVGNSNVLGLTSLDNQSAYCLGYTTYGNLWLSNTEAPVTLPSPVSGSYPYSAAPIGIGVSPDPTKSGIIAQLSDITTSLDGYYYIVIATSTKTDIQVDIDEVVTDLNSKADVYLSNVPTSKGILTESYVNGASWYRVYSDGWCEQGSLYYKGSSCQGNNTIEFLLPFKNISYTLTGMPFHTSTSYDLCEVYASRTTSSTVLYIGSGVFGFMWKVCGYIR